MRRREAAVKPGFPFISKSFTGHTVIQEFRIHVIVGFLEVYFNEGSSIFVLW